MDLLEQFEAFIQTNALFRPDERVLLAVSGGVDSVVLAHLMYRSGRPFGVAHCNFRLRGEDSDTDEAFVRSLAAHWRAPVFVQHFDTQKYAQENSQSIQMAARALRYRWFEVVREAEDFLCTATGHHLNDSIETALLHFIRGTGLTGLGGIPSRNGHIVRPLLFAPRSAIEAYARAQALDWREDSSNAKDDYTRNAIRHRIVPELEALNPSFLASAAQTLRRLRGADDNLQYLLRALLGQPDAAGVYHLDKAALAALPALRDALFDLLQPFGFLSGQVQEIAEAWPHTGAEWHSPAGYRLVIDRSELLLTNQDLTAPALRIGADDLLVRSPDGWRLIITPAAPDAPFPDGREAVVVDAGKLHFPLHLRRWQAGDNFQPFGMDGKSQKLQDFFTNQKLSRFEKEQLWVLENGDGAIVWVVGHRLDERFRVTTKTHKQLKFSWIK